MATDAAFAPRRTWLRRHRWKLRAAVLIPLLTFGIFWLTEAVERVRTVPARLVDAGNLTQIGLAIHSYHQANGHYPPPYVLGTDGRPWHSWRVLILPYMASENPYKDYRLDELWDGPNNRKLAERMPRPYAFSGSYKPGDSTANYLAVVGDETVWNPSKRVTEADVTDGLGTTIMLVENRVGVPWLEPRDLTLADLDFRVNSDGGISGPYSGPLVVTLDTGKRALNRGMKPDMLRALFTIRGGEPVGVNADGDWDWLPDGRMRDRVEP